MKLMLVWLAAGALALWASASSAGSPPALDATVSAFAREHGFGGAVVVQQRRRTLYSREFGLADRAFAVPVATDTRFKVGSITKLFTAVLILQLRDQGRLDLNRTIRAYLPEYPGQGADKITVHQLLNHTSGLPQYDDVASYQEAFAKGVDKYQRPLGAEALLKRCCSGALAAEPGARFDYNNADYFVLGRIVERLTGQSFEAALTERILRPLGMKDSGMLHWDEITPRLAATYFYRDDTKSLINDMPVYYENWYAAAGMYSTSTDLLTFADALYGGRLLSADSLRRLLTAGQDDYGYGLWSYTLTRGGKPYRVAKRPGRVMGANAVLYRLLDQGVTIVILGNTNRADLDVFAQRVADVLIAQEQRTAARAAPRLSARTNPH